MNDRRALRRSEAMSPEATTPELMFRKSVWSTKGWNQWLCGRPSLPSVKPGYQGLSSSSTTHGTGHCLTLSNYCCSFTRQHPSTYIIATEGKSTYASNCFRILIDRLLDHLVTRSTVESTWVWLIKSDCGQSHLSTVDPTLTTVEPILTTVEPTLTTVDPTWVRLSPPEYGWATLCLVDQTRVDWANLCTVDPTRERLTQPWTRLSQSEYGWVNMSTVDPICIRLIQLEYDWANFDHGWINLNKIEST